MAISKELHTNLPDGLFVGASFVTDGIDTRTGAGAISVDKAVTKLVTTGADALTLADGVEGQHKIIAMITDGGDGTLTPTNLRGGTTITFGDVGDCVHLIFLGAEWQIVANTGCVVV